ncbi:MAG: methionine synthase [Chloroflexi bacterium]|nr:methionine synthase [Chloroflexota bacterium]
MRIQLEMHLQQGNHLVADGAMGSMLQDMGLPAGTPPEIWNLEHPEEVASVHRAYVEAGAEVILTNTLGGTRLRLDHLGDLGARVAELNEAGARVARRAADGRAFVAGDVGPIGELMAPLGELQYTDAVNSYSEQARILADSGVDLIWIETMNDLQEAQAAIEGARHATDLPIFCSFSFTRRSRTIMGVTPEQVARTLWPLGLAAVGANCGEGVEHIPGVLQAMKKAQPEAILIAKPNAGIPHLEAGRTVFDLGPDDLAAYAPRFVEAGAQIIGACCGSTPAHISAIAAAIGNQR